MRLGKRLLQQANLRFYYPTELEMDDEGVRLLGSKKQGV